MSPRSSFLAIPRAGLESKWYRIASPLVRALWVELLLLANYGESVTKKGLAIKPGQLVTSWAFLAGRLASVQEDGRRKTPPPTNIRRAAAFLEKAGEVTWQQAKHAAGGGTLITLVRWGFYAGQGTGAASLAADQSVDSLAKCAAIQEERDPALPSQGRETPEERRQRTREKDRQAIEETRRILEQEMELRRGTDETVH